MSLPELELGQTYMFRPFLTTYLLLKSSTIYLFTYISLYGKYGNTGHGHWTVCSLRHALYFYEESMATLYILPTFSVPRNLYVICFALYADNILLFNGNCAMFELFFIFHRLRARLSAVRKKHTLNYF